MSVHYAAYNLQNGYVHNWIVAGPQTVPITDLDRFAGKDFEFQIASNHYEEAADITEPHAGQMEIRYGDQAMRLNFAI